MMIPFDYVWSWHVRPSRNGIHLGFVQIDEFPFMPVTLRIASNYEFLLRIRQGARWLTSIPVSSNLYSQMMPFYKLVTYCRGAIFEIEVRNCLAKDRKWNWIDIAWSGYKKVPRHAANSRTN